MDTSALIPTELLNLFYLIDDFCKEIEPHIAKKAILPSIRRPEKELFS